MITDKTAIRHTMKHRRDGLTPEEVLAKSEAIAVRLFAVLAFRRAKVVMLYMSFRNEVFTYRMVADTIASGKMLCLPRLNRSTDAIEASQVVSLDGDLAPGTMGILEPSEQRMKRIAPTLIDTCVVPGIAFDLEGTRIGWGRGYYDRFLSMLRPDAAKIGLAYDFQVVEVLPRRPYDVALDYVVTETQTLAFRRP